MDEGGGGGGGGGGCQPVNPCWQQLPVPAVLAAVDPRPPPKRLQVTPTSVAASQASEDFKGYVALVDKARNADPAQLPPGMEDMLDSDANAMLMNYHLGQLAKERAQCAAVVPDLLYVEGSEEELRGKGEFGMKCGEGPAAQNPGQPSTGRYLLLARTPINSTALDAQWQPGLVAFCGPFRVCARPAAG